MRKWSFWGLMCLVSLIALLCLVSGDLGGITKGIPGVDNQGAPAVHSRFLGDGRRGPHCFCAWTLWIGRAWIERGYPVFLVRMIFFARRSHREKRWGAVFFLLTGVLVWRGLLLIHPSDSGPPCTWRPDWCCSSCSTSGSRRAESGAWWVVQLMCALLACAVWLLLAGS